VNLARELGVRMCEAWGLNPNDVFAIDLRWRPDEYPTAIIQVRTAEGVVREILELTRRTP